MLVSIPFARFHSLLVLMMCFLVATIQCAQLQTSVGKEVSVTNCK